jgi:2-dehydro-3-deoxygluconokinase
VAPARTTLVGNLLLDVFLDTAVYPPPEGLDGPVHRSYQETKDILADVKPGLQGGTDPGVTLRAGGAAGNAARILADLGHASTLRGAVGEDVLAARYRSLLHNGVHSEAVEQRLEVTTAAPTGVSVTWYEPYGNDRPGCLVSPPPVLLPAFWNNVLRDLPGTALLYLDGYALPSFFHSPVSGQTDRLAQTGASLLLDLAHPAVTGGYADQLLSVLRTLASAGTRVTVFASAEELAPLGGRDSVASAVKRGSVTLIRKEPPAGATVYRLHGGRAEPVARHHGESVHPIETTGLGDAFVAGWIAALLDGLTSPAEQAERAHAVALRCAGQVGGAIQAG